MRRHRQDIKPLTEMNVTNLLDTALTLLMAFMVVAPAMQHGVKLQLPEVSAEQIDTKKTVTVVIAPPRAEGESIGVYVDDQRMTNEDLVKFIIAQKAKFEEMDVVMEVDRSIPYENFLETLAAIKAAGIENVGLMSDPIPKE